MLMLNVDVDGDDEEEVEGGIWASAGPGLWLCWISKLWYLSGSTEE
jgi:hypothetical protein